MQIGYLKPLHDFWCLAYKLKELATHQKHVKAYWNNLQIFPLCKTLSKALELSEAVVQGCSVKKVFLKFTGKHLCQSLFFNEVAGSGLQFYLKRGSSAGVFLWILRNFEEHLLLQNTSGGSFRLFQFLMSKKQTYMNDFIQ